MPVLSQRFNMACEIYGAGVIGPYLISGAPVAGTNEVQTLTLGGSPTTDVDSFVLSLDGMTTGAILWSNVNATLLTRMTTALNARFGTSEIVPTAGTVTAGIGTVLLTFSGTGFGKKAVSTMTGSRVSGSSLTVAVAETTPGVNQTLRDVAKGALVLDVTNGQLYQQTAAAGTPTFQKVGAQT